MSSNYLSLPCNIADFKERKRHSIIMTLSFMKMISNPETQAYIKDIASILLANLLLKYHLPFFICKCDLYGEKNQFSIKMHQ